MIGKFLTIFWLIENSLSKCSHGCLSCFSLKEKCVLCDNQLNFTMGDGVCFMTIYPNCLTYTIDGMCLSCSKDHYIDPVSFGCVKVPSEKIDPNCEVQDTSEICKICKPDYYLKDKSCSKVDQPIPNCLIYAKDNPLLCSQCTSDSYLSLDKALCIVKPNPKICKIYSKVKCLNCKIGYLENKNLYIQTLIDFYKWNVTENLKDWISDRKNLKINQCAKTKIENCQEYIDSKKCKTCQEGFLKTSDSKCINMPLSGINNCKVFVNFNTCIKCHENYYLESKSSCKPVEPIENCVRYSSTYSSRFCIACINDYYLSALNTCTKRTKKIKDCLEYMSNQDKCSKCDQTKNLITTTDNLACLPAVSNCASYSPSVETSLRLVCNGCVSLFSYITATETCEKGVISQCVDYEKDNVCLKCSEGFFLFSNKCWEQSPIDFCLTYSGSANNTCDKCNKNSYKFKLVNYCFPFVSIPFCTSYQDVSSCAQCNDGYKTDNDQKCVRISDSLNCLQISQGQCVKCKPNFFLNSGLCESPSDYLINTCASHNINGTTSKTQIQCFYCLDKYIPFNMRNYYVCTDREKFNINIPFCKKFGITTSGRFTCDKCQDGYMVFSGICVNSCPSSSVLYLAKYVVSFQQLAENKKTVSFKLSHSEICEEPPVGTVNCEVMVPGIALFEENTGENSFKGSHVCQACKQGTIKVVTRELYEPGKIVGVKNVPTSYTQKTFYSSSTTPIEMYHSFDCLLKTNVNFYKSDGTTNSITEVDNCELYYLPTATYGTGPNYVVCCFKCKHGFSGKAFLKSTSQKYACIETCTAITDCNTAIFYHGLSRNLTEIKFAKGLLETYTTCHVCTGTKFPVTFISFTKETDYDSTQGVKTLFPRPTLFHIPVPRPIEKSVSIIISKCLPGGSALSYNGRFWANILSSATVTKYNFPSTQTSSVRCVNLAHTDMLDNPYKFNEEFNDSLISGAKVLSTHTMTSCQNIAGSTFSDNLNGGMTNLVVSNCLLYIANADMFPIAMDDGASDSLVTRKSVYCAGCKPGFRPKNPYSSRLPFFANSCEQIPNCDTTNSQTNSWANFCQTCQTNYMHYFDLENREIDFSRCEQKPTNALNCFAVSLVNNVLQCTLCQKGYFLNEDYYCDQILIENCLDTDFNFYNLQTFKLESLNYNIGQLIGFFSKDLPSCVNCAENKISFRMIEDSFICVKSKYVFDELQIPNSFYKSPKCQSFYIDLFGKYKCVRCSNVGTKRIIGSDGFCYTFNSPVHQFCQYALSNSACDQCNDEAVFVNGVCVKKTILFCLEYQNQKDLTSQKCLQCSEFYYASSDKSECILGKDKNCLTYNSNQQCQSCVSGYVIASLLNGQTFCFKIPSNLKCQAYDFNFQNGVMKCTQCNVGHIFSPNGEYPRNVCLQFESVPNCLIYDNQKELSQSTLKCSQCEDRFFLNELKSCSVRSKIDPNCAIMTIKNDECAICKEGYYIHVDKLTCLPNPSGILGCEQYLDESKCLFCNSSFYLSQGICIALGTSIGNCKNQNSPTECQICNSGFYLSPSKQCLISDAKDCLINASKFACLTCNKGFGLKTENGVTDCVRFPDVNCKTNSPNFPFECFECVTDYFPDAYKVCQPVTQKIDGCLFYSDNGFCSRCNSTTILSIDKTSCLSSPEARSLIDENCENQQFISNELCVACEMGYYFDDSGECKECTNDCAICDPGNNGSCKVCKTGFYMNIDLKCIKYELIRDTTISTSSFTPSSSLLQGNIQPNTLYSSRFAFVISFFLLSFLIMMSF